MAERTEKIIIEVIATEQKLGEVAEKISTLKDRNVELRKEMKNGATTWAEGTKIIKENEATIKMLQSAEKQLAGQLAVSTSANRKYGDSNVELRANVADLEKQYNSLTKAQKDTSGGQEMLKHLTELKATVKANAEELGNFQDSVGNYGIVAKSLKAELKEIVYNMAQMKLQGQENSDEYRNLQQRGGELKDTLSDVQTELKNVGSDTRGIDQVIGAFKAVGAVAQVAQGAAALMGAENEEVTKSIQKLVAIQSLMNGVQEVGNALQKESTFMLGLKTAGQKISAAWTITLTALEKAFGITAASAMAAATLGVSLLITGIILLIGNFNTIISSIKSFFGVTDKFKDVKTDIDNTTKALENFGKKTDLVADRLASEGLGDQALLNFKRKRFDEELKMQRSLYTDIKKLGDKANDDQKEQLKSAADFIKTSSFQKYQFDTEQISLNNKKKDEALQKDKERAEAGKQLNQKYSENQKQAAATAIEINRQLNDAILQSRKDGVAKEIEIEQENVRRQKEDIQKRIDTEKNLTEKATLDLIALQKQLQTNSDAKVKQMQADAKQEKLDKDIESEQKRISLLLEVAEKGSENELSLRKQAIENLRRQEISEAEKLGYDKDAINKKYDNQIEEANKQSIQRKEQARKQALDNEFNDLKLRMDIANASALQIAQTEQEQAQIEAANIILLDAETKAALYESQAAYDAAVIESKSKVVKASQAVIDAEQKQLETQVAMVQGFGDAISSVLSEVAGNNKDALVFQKMIALANVSLSLAEAIAAATASSTKGDPYTMALRIATNVASVVVAFSQVTKAIKATQIPSQPKFSTGLLAGAVQGNPTTGDSVQAWLTPGERVLNAQQQENLFKMIANGNFSGGSGIDYDLLAKAMSRQPAPILNYKEFTDFQQKIVTFDEHIKL